MFPGEKKQPQLIKISAVRPADYPAGIKQKLFQIQLKYHTIQSYSQINLGQQKRRWKIKNICMHTYICMHVNA